MQSCEAENLGAEILLRRVFLLGSVTPVTPVTLAGKAAEAEGPASFCRSKGRRGRHEDQIKHFKDQRKTSSPHGSPGPPGPPGFLVLRVLQVLWSSWSCRSSGFSKVFSPSCLVLLPGPPDFLVFWSSTSSGPPGFLTKCSGGQETSTSRAKLRSWKSWCRDSTAQGFRAEVSLLSLLSLWQAKLQKQKDQQAFVEAKAGGVGMRIK